MPKTITSSGPGVHGCHKRNGEIELVRFLAALLILCTHANHFPGCPTLCPEGRIAVEFFFVLSGYLLAASASRAASPVNGSQSFLHYETAGFLWHKIKAFWFELAVACSIGTVIYAFCHWPDSHFIMSKCIDTVFGDVLLLKMTGFVANGVNPVAWYLSAMVISCAVLYPLIRKFGVSPAYLTLGLLLMGGIYLADDRNCGFAGVTHWMGFTYKGNLRALSELLVGVSLYPMAMKLSRLNCALWLKVLLTLFKWACWGGMVIYAAFPVYNRVGVVFVCIAAAILLSFSNICCDKSWYQTRMSLWLGRLSLPLYLSHHFYAKNLGFFISGGIAPALKMAVYLACSLATALFVMWAAGQIRQRLSAACRQ
ncbi:MAG: acyltransferase [Akkermansia sp.]|nr:acyltransferase [Akkermansia sp.]